MMVNLINGKMERDWRFNYLTLIVAFLVTSFSFTIEYFTRKTFAKEMKLKVKFQRKFKKKSNFKLRTN